MDTPPASRMGTPAPSTVTNTVLMHGSSHWQVRGRERRGSMVCCDLNPHNKRSFPIQNVEWGSEQPSLVDGVPARSRGLELDGL